jgi:hypothetical protein
MVLTNNLVRKYRTIFTLLFAMFFLTSQAQQTQVSQPDMHAKWKAWHETMKRTPKPNNTGCFKATYPETAWQETICQTAPLIPYPPAKGAHPSAGGTVGGAHPFTVGDGTDYSASVTGTLSSATGSFPVVSGLSSANAYSLQLNSQFFTTSVCSGAATPSACRGWQQFLYTSSPSETFMQYWLLDWGKTCPSGWTTNNNGQINCYKNSSATSATAPLLANWNSLELEGASASGTDRVTFYDGGINVSASGADTVLNLELGWDQAEFNVFGNGNLAEVNFNSGATFVIETSLVNGTTTAPACQSAGFTGETNNLSLVGACCPYAASGSLSPNIQFLESNNSAATASCGTGALQTNLTAVPSSSGTYVSSGGEYPNITFTETLTDATSGAQIYWTVAGCSGSTSGSDPLSSGGSFGLYYSREPLYRYAV